MANQSQHQSGSVMTAITGLLSSRDIPGDLPDDPVPLLMSWYAEAEASGEYDDFNAMTIATATPDGVPSARMVLCKSIEPARPALVFYTSYRSRKAGELEANPRAAAVFHWPHAKRQVRVEGTIARVSEAESDAYFATRPLLSRIGATVSHQSAPLNSQTELATAAMKLAGAVALGGELPRPRHWGGYRLLVRRIELWSGRQGRLHDRVRWTRGDGVGAATWVSERLSP